MFKQLVEEEEEKKRQTIQLLVIPKLFLPNLALEVCLCFVFSAWVLLSAENISPWGVSIVLYQRKYLDT